MNIHTTAGRKGPRRGADRNGPRVSGAAIGFACAAVIGIGTVVAQDISLLPRFPVLLSEISAPAIDRGIRDVDPPRPPRTERETLHSAVASEGEPFLRGSIIVKFRPGTTPGAQRAMLAQVDGATTPA